MWRYDAVMLGPDAKTKSIPVTRSLINKPKVGRIEYLADGKVFVQWPGADKPQPIPLDLAKMWLVRPRQS
jgi:hypothetical protein